MARLLFSLRYVSDDEADDIRALLTNNHIKYYETSAGNWGISMPAIWLYDDSQFEQARNLINAYEDQRRINAQLEYAELKQSGKANSFIKNLLYYPLQTIFLLAVICMVLYISFKLVFELGI